jgi:hypothetical protein
MKMYGGVDVYIHVILTLALVGERSASTSSCFNPGGKSPQYTLNRRLGGPKTGLDDVEKT